MEERVEIGACDEVGAHVSGAVEEIAQHDFGGRLARNFADENVELHTLTNYDTLIEVACQEEYIRASEQESLANWRKNPEAWSDAHM